MVQYPITNNNIKCVILKIGILCITYYKFGIRESVGFKQFFSGFNLFTRNINACYVCSQLCKIKTCLAQTTAIIENFFAIAMLLQPLILIINTFFYDTVESLVGIFFEVLLFGHSFSIGFPFVMKLSLFSFAFDFYLV